jgi:hypothetical protein
MLSARQQVLDIMDACWAGGTLEQLGFAVQGSTPQMESRAEDLLDFAACLCRARVRSPGSQRLCALAPFSGTFGRDRSEGVSGSQAPEALRASGQ